MFRPYEYRYWIVVIICMDHKSAKACKLRDRDISYFALHNEYITYLLLDVFSESKSIRARVSGLAIGTIKNCWRGCTKNLLLVQDDTSFSFDSPLVLELCAKSHPYTRSQFATRKGSWFSNRKRKNRKGPTFCVVWDLLRVWVVYFKKFF